MFTFPIAFFKAASGGGGGDTYTNYYSNEFDGSNDYVDMGNILDQDGSNAFTISAWVNVEDLASFRCIVAKQNNASPQVGYSFYVRETTGRLSFQLRNASGTGWHIQTTDNTLSAGTWYHVAVTYDGSKNSTGCEIYVNGTACTISGSGSFTGSSSSTDSFQIGARDSASLWMKGKIDEVAFFDSELSASDVTAIYNSGSPDSLASQSNLKGWWRMGDGAKHPIIKNQAHFSQTATYYDGGSNYVTDIDFSDFASASNLSISVWAQYQGGNRIMIGTVGGLNYSVLVNTWGSNLYWQIRNGGTQYSTFSFSGLMSIGDWFHLVCTFDGTQSSNADKMKMYFNGQQKTLSFVGTMPSTISSSVEVLELGRQSSYGTSNWFLGKLDDVSIYNTTLSASDITDIYNSGYPKDESERSGLVSYYKFDGDTYPVVRDALQFSNASLDFDGTNDYVDCGNSDIFSFGDGSTDSAFSISGWCNMTDATDFILVSKDNTSAREYNIRFVSDKIHVYFLDNSAGGYIGRLYNTTVTSYQGQWIHIAITYSGNSASSGIKIYLNGTRVDDTNYEGGSYTAMENTGTSLRIGSQQGSGGLFSYGSIDDVLITSTELSASDVTDIYNSGKPKDESSLSNILGYWRMGDNTISPNVPSALGYGTHSVNFDGIDDYVTMGDVLDQDGTSAFSMSFWVNLDSTANQQLCGKMTHSGNYEGYSCYIFSNSLRFAIVNTWSSNTLAIEMNASLSTGVWQHIAITYDGSQNASGTSIYINGSAEATTTLYDSLGSTSSTTASFIIGSRGSGYYANGKIKQVGIFNAELSASDVTSIYNSGLPKDISSESGLVSYYRMGDGEDKFPNILDYKGTNHGTMTNMASDDITTANVGAGTMTNMDSTDIVADSPSGTSGQMTNMDSGDFVAAKGAGTMTNMTAEDIVTTTP